MKRRALGVTGLDVPVVGLGTGSIGGEDLSDGEAERVLDAAWDLGIDLFDTAPSYGLAEARIGRWRAARGRAVVLSTKGGYGAPGVPDWTPDAVLGSLEGSLRRLRVDCIDIVHLHSCPRATLERGGVLEALARGREQGKVRVVAYSGENDALAFAAEAPAVGALQCSVNLFDQGSLREIIPRAAARGLGVLAKRTLGNAPWRFVERPAGDYAELYWERMYRLGYEAGPYGWARLALRFAAFAPGVSAVLCGSRTPAHLEEIVRAAEEGPLPAPLFAHLRATYDERGAAWEGQV